MEGRRCVVFCFIFLTVSSIFLSVLVHLERGISWRLFLGRFQFSTCFTLYPILVLWGFSVVSRFIFQLSVSETEETIR